MPNLIEEAEREDGADQSAIYEVRVWDGIVPHLEAVAKRAGYPPQGFIRDILYRYLAGRLVERRPARSRRRRRSK